MNGRKTILVALLAVATLVAAGQPAYGSPIKWLTVQLGTHPFGHLRAPDAVVARGGADAVGFECGKPSACSAQAPAPSDSCGCIDVLPQGPTSFDIGRDGSVWVFDGVKHRLVAWRSGRIARTVTLPRDVGDSDFVLGREGTVYVFGGNVPHRPYLTMYALTSSGRVRWKAATTVASSQARLALAGDGSVYSVGPSATPTWTPLTTPAGRPLTLATQRRRSSRLQPLARGLRVLTTQVSSHEVHFALVDGHHTVVRAWRVTSRTSLGLTRLVPALVGDDLVVAVEVSQQVGKAFRMEDVVLRLTSSGGTRVRFSLDARAVWDPDGTTARTTLRVAADGRLYQLRTSPTTGVSVARYSL
jgi:hypothetical protein